MFNLLIILFTIAIMLERGEHMIANKLSEVMGRKRLKISDVVNMTGLARNTVTELYHGRAKQVHFETLDKLCIALDCRLDEILDHVSEEKTEPKE